MVYVKINCLYRGYILIGQWFWFLEREYNRRKVGNEVVDIRMKHEFPLLHGFN